LTGNGSRFLEGCMACGLVMALLGSAVVTAKRSTTKACLATDSETSSEAHLGES